MTPLDKTTLAVVYLGLRFEIPVVLAIVAVERSWRGVSAMAQKLGSIGLHLCHRFIVIRNWKHSGVWG